MKRALLVASFLLMPLAASAVGYRQWSESQSATRSAPTLSTEGLDLRYVVGFRLTACATTGTLATACTLQAYVFNETTGLWVRSASSSSAAVGYTDWQLLAADAGKACVTFPDQLPAAPRGRVLYATSSCDALTLYLEAVTQ